MDFSDEQLERYARHILLDEVGLVGQERIVAARVLVVGEGKAVTILCLYLAAAGVGTLGVATLSPGEELREEILALNPEVSVRLLAPEAVTEGAVADFDLVADCSRARIPGEETRPDLREVVGKACAAHSKAVVSSHVAGEVAAVTALRSDRGEGCPACILWPEEDRAANPLAAPVAGLVASAQATEVLKVITQVGEPLFGRLLTIDSHASEFLVRAAQRKPRCRICGLRSQQ